MFFRAFSPVSSLARHYSTTINATPHRIRLVSVLFGGQGSQFSGMSRQIFSEWCLQTSVGITQIHEHLATQYPELLRMMITDQESIASALGNGGDVRAKEMLQQSDRVLTLTRNAQPAILAHSVALWQLFKEKLQPLEILQWSDMQRINNSGSSVVLRSVLGHSLGEYSALVANGALDVKDAIDLVHQRGKIMEDCIAKAAGLQADAQFDPREHFAMAAVLNSTEDEIIKAIDAVRNELLSENPSSRLVCELANLNTEQQTVISGHAVFVKRVAQHFKQNMKRVKCVMLDVGAPFHCSLMKPAAEAFGPLLALNSALWRTAPKLHTPLISNVTTEMINDTQQLVQLMQDQIFSPVRWYECVARGCAALDAEKQALQQAHPSANVSTMMIEFSPQSTLIPMLKRTKAVSTAPDEIVSVSEPAHLDKILAAFASQSSSSSSSQDNEK